MYVNVKFVRKILDNMGELVLSKKHDFIAKDKGEYIMIYRRWYEGKPWSKFCKIEKKDLNDHTKWFYYEEGKEKLGEKFVI